MTEPTMSVPVGGIRDRAYERELLVHLAKLRVSDDPEDQRQAAKLRADLIPLHIPLVEHLVRRFLDRGEPHDDLLQVGTIGLINAIDRFDPDRGVEFSTYATPTIVGEIKRHFRDKGWAVRVPRRLQEMRAALSKATETLSHDLGRAPTVAELARKLEVSEDDVLEGLESASAYATISLDAGFDDTESASITDSLGFDDEALALVEDRATLRPLLEALPERERRIVMLRFFHNLTQSQIADEIGVSQMHVSRLLTRALVKLRKGMSEAHAD